MIEEVEVELSFISFDKRCAICGEDRELYKCAECGKEVCAVCAIDRSDKKICLRCNWKGKIQIAGDEPEEGERPKVICIDFDGVINSYRSGWMGEGCYDSPVEGCADALRALKEQGWYIIVFTCRNERDDIAEYLKKNAIPYDKINEPYPDEIADKSSNKPHADVYLDDKAINFGGNWAEALLKILAFEPWHKKGVI